MKMSSSLSTCCYLLMALGFLACIQARSLLNHEELHGVWQPSDGDREEWMRCHGFPCDQWERTQDKVKRLKYMAQATGERAKLNDGETPPDDNPSDDSLDGCIWLTEEQIDGITEKIQEEWEEEEHRGSRGASHGNGRSRQKRKLKDFSNFLYGMWEMPLRWKFDGNHDDNQRNIIRGAFRHWEANTCIRFQELGTNEYSPYSHLLITRENTGCHSFIGRINTSPQQLNLQDICVNTFGTIVHEIGHALGLWHEQQRADRDQHIRIIQENLGYYAGQFVKQSTVSFGVPYDVGSVMHYDSFAGSKNGGRTIETLDPLEQSSLGQRTGLSFLDAKIINAAYCGDVCKNKLFKPCEHGGYQDPNSCNKCKCPDGFDGDFCEYLAASNANCGGEINLKADGSMAYIETPNYGSYYENHQECNWHIKAPYGYHAEMEFVEKFAVYCHYSAQCYHWVEVKYNKETLDRGEQGARFCCYSRPKDVIQSEDQELVITFRANWTAPYSTSRRGFKARFIAVRDDRVESITDSPTTTPSTAQSTMTTPKSTASSTTTTSTVMSTTTTPRPTEPLSTGDCHRMDLVFVLDSSGSVMASNWLKVLKFTQNIISNLPINQDAVRVGIVSYGNSATAHILLTDFNEEMDLSSAILKIAFKDQWTNTGEGLRVAREEVFNASPRRDGGRRVLVMITDGESNRDQERTIPEANNAQDAGIEIVALAVGPQANLEEAALITGNKANVLTISDFDILASPASTERVLDHMCDQDMMKPSTPRSLEWSCSFEKTSDPICGMDQSSDDHFDWSRWSGGTPSQETGPSSAYDGDYYMYIEASKPRKENDMARLLLPRITEGGVKCFRFHYNMNGYHVNSLEIIQLASGLRKTLWLRAGNNGDHWKEGVIEATFEEGDRMAIIGTVGQEFSGDIAIDMLELYSGTCSE